jgi:putative transcriptional regulator
MRKIIAFFIIIFFYNIYLPVKAIELPKYYKFPKNYFKGKHYNSVKDLFLVSTKEMKDSRFEKTVILMLKHNNNGALGIVINKQLGKITLGSLINKIEDQSINKKELYDIEIPIYWGGPVDKNKILILHTNDYKNETTKKYNKLSISNDLKTLVKIAEEKGPKKSLVILGMSAWNIGQLDGEIEMESWTLSEMSMDLIFEVENNKKWLKALSNSFIRL